MFSFAGTELVGLAAAETANPRKALPTAIKQVFWRIAIFYIVSLMLVSFLVPFNEPRLLGAKNSVDASASPFVIAIESAGKTILPSVMNVVILIAVISVGNSAVFGASRTLAALAQQAQAPKIFAYVDRQGRPLVAIGLSLALGLLAYLADVKAHSIIFDWLFAISGLSSLFTWASICMCHIRFRQAWSFAGRTLEQLPFRSQMGTVGSWFALVGYLLILCSQFWVAGSPVGEQLAGADLVQNFFLTVMALPIVFLFWICHKIWFKTRITPIRSIDVDTGRRYGIGRVAKDDGGEQTSWPLWKKIFRSLC